MDPVAILSLVSQGLGLLPTMLKAGMDIYQDVQNLKNLSAAGANGTATDAQVQTVQDRLDQLMAQFNAPDPGEAPSAA